MENASKALLMAAGVLIGILILSLAVFLFVDFGGKSKVIHEQIDESKLVQYNAQYTIYEGRTDITIYEVVSVINLAKQNNKDYKDYSDFDNLYKVNVTVNGSAYNGSTIEDMINDYVTVNSNGELKDKFKVSRLEYHENGRVKSINFEKIL